jgi:hypothetical protein
MGRLEASNELHARARAMVRAFEARAPMPESFDRLACDLARFQAENIEGYARLCRARGVDVLKLERAADAPAVPTDAFKLTRVATFPAADAAAVFRTSGTTSDSRGTHAMRDVATYDAAALAFGRCMLLSSRADLAAAEPPTRGDDAPRRLPIAVLGPPPSAAPDSSLTHMFALFARELGTPASDAETFLLENGVFDLATFDDRVARALVEGTPVLVLATSFALVHLLDALGDDVFRLPQGSRVMQTGGFKGRAHTVDEAVLRREVARALMIEPGAVLSEYGMTELSSQFYEAPPGPYLEPPWARVVPVDPETLAPVRDGEIGIARIEDLMNVDSAFAVLAGDRVRRRGAGFELLGRAPGAPPRGCSIAIDEMMHEG